MWLAYSFYYWYAYKIYSADSYAVAAIILRFSFFIYCKKRYFFINALDHLIIQFQEPQHLVLVVGLVNLKNVALVALVVK